MRPTRRLNFGKDRFLYSPNRALIALVKGPLFDPLSSNQACLGQNLQVFTGGGMADAELSGNQTAADSVADKVSVDLGWEMLSGVLEPGQYFDPLLIGQGPKGAIDLHYHFARISI
jgi:hypothetical protein